MLTRESRWILASLLLFAFGLILAAPVFADTYKDALQEGAQLFKAEKYDEATKSLAKAAESQDAVVSKLACSILGMCYIKKGDSDLTIMWFERALEKDAQFLEVLETLSSVYFNEQRTYAKGMKLAERAEALNSRNPDVYYNMARFQSLEGRAGLALDYLDKAIYFGYLDFAHLGSDADFEAVRNVEPLRRLFIHLDSISSAQGLRLQAMFTHAIAGASDGVIQLYQDTLERYEQALGTNSLASATILLYLAASNSEVGKYQEAIGFFEKALSIELKVLGAEHPDVGKCYTQLGSAYGNKGDYDRAISCCEKALAIQLKVLGPEHLDVARSYITIGMAIALKSENDRAIGYYEKALAIRLKVLGSEHRDVGACYYCMGGAYMSKAEYDRAINYWEKALAIEQKALGPEHKDVALSYINIGAAYSSKGEYDRAINYYEKALAIQQKALGPEHKDVALSYKNIGAAYNGKGEYDRAIGYHEKALAIWLKVLGTEHPDVAASYNNLGAAYNSKGDYDRAIGYFESALAIIIRTFGDQHPDIADSYNNMGAVYNSKGEYDRAIGYHQKALAIRLKALGAEHPYVATSYNNLGTAYYSKGASENEEYNRTIGYFEKALAIQLKVLGTGHPNVATSYINLGKVYEEKGEYDRAIVYYEKALRTVAKTGSRELSLNAAANLGWADFHLGHYVEARKAFRQGVAMIEQARGETGAGKADFTARYIFLYYLSLQASAAMNDMAGVFEAAEAMRARGFLDRLSLSAALSVEGVLADARSKMLSLNDELENLSAQRSAEFQKPESKQDKQRLLSIVNDLQAKQKEFADLDQSLMANIRYKELRKPSLASLKDAQQLLAENQAILEYVLWEQEKGQQAWCLVIRKSGADLVELDKSFAFSKTVTDYRESILNGTAAREKLGAQLYEKLIASVEGKLSGVGKLIIVPDGALAFLPFDALRKDESSPYLAERFQLSLAPSVSVLRMVGGREYGSRAGRWLALGGARYSGQGAQAERGRRSASSEKTLGEKTKEYNATRGAGAYYDGLGIQWDDLPGTREEVLAVQQAVYGGTGTRVILGEQASEKLVKELSGSGELSQQRVVHFACHGRYDAEYPAYSAVVLSEVSGALKGSSVEDGYLNVEEVALLKLKAEMVELSACETGLGKVVKGDGVIGLTRAFLVAGANRVGVTLWVVDDLATKEFMVRVYGLVEQEGMSYGEAMVKVKREFIKSKDYSDPYYWSPFVMYGK